MESRDDRRKGQAASKLVYLYSPRARRFWAVFPDGYEHESEK
jgi:hypothetical protein